MRLVKINTTAYMEEDFFLHTDLNNDDLYEVIMPIVNAERDGEEEYDNGMIIAKLKERYPNNIIIMYDDIETIIY